MFGASADARKPVKSLNLLNGEMLFCTVMTATTEVQAEGKDFLSSH